MVSDMKVCALFAMSLLAAVPLLAADYYLNADGEAVRNVFGEHWQEIPPPTIEGSNAMAAVDAFVAAHGWNMDKSEFFYVFSEFAKDKSRPIRGLPWKEIHDLEFEAETHDEILYVKLHGTGNWCTGIAYNPKTNIFAFGLHSFKPIGQHWYAWERSETSTNEIQAYEGGVSLPVRRSVSLSEPPWVDVICRLKAYRLGFDNSRIYSEEAFEKLKRSSQQDLRLEVTGFLFEIVSPPKFAGKSLSSHFDGVVPSGDPFLAFTFGKQYLMHISEKYIGDESFRICY